MTSTPAFSIFLRLFRTHGIELLTHSAIRSTEAQQRLSFPTAIAMRKNNPISGALSPTSNTFSKSQCTNLSISLFPFCC
ncbi:MAG: hypothetical protein E7045_07600 [Lentisphaerae bacterium]|nr:hypothetical protein [Lentisphaerota bacterium]